MKCLSYHISWIANPGWERVGKEIIRLSESRGQLWTDQCAKLSACLTKPQPTDYVVSS